MLLRCLKAEGIKCRRAPVWLAFLVLPLFPAMLGTVNYLGNLEVLEDGWYSLWTQHTLFASMFFLPAQFGVFCAWQWRLEHIDHNWNRFLTAPVPIRDLCLAKLVLSGGISLLAQALEAAGYVSNAAQNETVLSIMRHAFSTIPGILWVATAAALFFYKLNKRTYNRIVEVIRHRAAKKRGLRSIAK